MKQYDPLAKYKESASLESINSIPEFLNKKLIQILCPKCNRDMKEVKGKYGYFFSCVLYPICKGKRKAVKQRPFLILLSHNEQLNTNIDF